MRFEEALQAMREGKNATNKNRHMPLTVDCGELCECGSDGGSGIIIWKIENISVSEIMQEDWEILND